MSDEILSFDTLMQPAGDEATIGDALANASSDAPGAADAASGANDASGASDILANATDTSVPDAPDATPTPPPEPQPGANTDTGIDPSEKVPTQPAPQLQPMDPVHADSLQPMTSDNPAHINPTAKGGGILDNASALMLGKALAGGATGAMTALAMRNKLQAEREKEERQRQDVIRRGQVPAFAPGTFTPKSGIIDGAMGKP